ncbi:hypothetical protein L1277_000269 [Okibacterium sp. HSC-33S16]|uniref:DUF4349 domain-containing protein n=1 Tax=Okibacterium sp. HSC-33S16 TaxID=2910965 RepID=UPI0020A202B5|nr:DUF4349 domain-containing protein [Okibacterium sp. HSC-33S16]MCP2030205.1 hypothetical protein [Okibacterium sp. HSC-33S16]
MRLAHRLTAVLAILAATTVLAGCTAGGGPSGGSAPDIAQLSPGDGGVRTETGDTDRSVVSTASVSLISSDPAKDTERIVTIVTDAGGRVDNRTDSPATIDTPASGSLTVRIPANRLESALTAIKEIGELRHSSLSSTDVTDQAIDLDARVTALRASTTRLLALIDRASTTADLIQLESALSERQADLDSLEAQRDALTDAVEYATVQVEVQSPAAVAGAAPGDFWGGIVVGFTSLVAFFSGLLVVLGILLPWLILLGLMAAAVWFGLRRRRAAPVEPVQPADTNSYSPGQATEPSAPPRPPLPPEHSRTTPHNQTPDSPA